MKYLTTLVQTKENNELFFDIPFEILDVLGWKEGDTLIVRSQEGRIVLSKESLMGS